MEENNNKSASHLQNIWNYAKYSAEYTAFYTNKVGYIVIPTVWSATKSSIYYSGQLGSIVLSPIWDATKVSGSYVLNYTGKIGNSLFQPSRVNYIAGFIPFLGNFVLFGSGIHAYLHGETQHGHQKMIETVIGTTMDLMSVGSAVEGLKLLNLGLKSSSANLCVAGSQVLITDIAQRVVGRVGAFLFVNSNLINAPYYKYQNK